MTIKVDDSVESWAGWWRFVFRSGGAPEPCSVQELRADIVHQWELELANERIAELREVAQLPNPLLRVFRAQPSYLVLDDTADDGVRNEPGPRELIRTHCQWCGGVWAAEHVGDFHEPTCLWPRARKAAAK